MIVLGGDIGGTNSRLALFVDGAPAFERTYPSGQYPSLEATVVAFLDEAARALGPGARPERACLGIAGPVENGRARVTNLPWIADERELAARTGIVAFHLVNDFHAAASGVTRVPHDQLRRLGGGEPVAGGPIAVMGPGTGLGEAFLLWSAAERRYLVAPSEGGHADFAPRTPLEVGLLGHLSARHGPHVSFERVLSGPGLRDIFGYLMTEPACRAIVSAETRAAIATAEDTAAMVVQGANAGDALCRVAVHLFASVLGSLAGNLALTLLSTGGVYLAGGIAPRIVTLLEEGGFRESFEDKGRLRPVLKNIPVYVVMHREVGLIGAAALAAGL